MDSSLPERMAFSTTAPASALRWSPLSRNDPAETGLRDEARGHQTSRRGETSATGRVAASRGAEARDKAQPMKPAVLLGEKFFAQLGMTVLAPFRGLCRLNAGLEPRVRAGGAPSCAPSVY